MKGKGKGMRECRWQEATLNIGQYSPVEYATIHSNAMEGTRREHHGDCQSRLAVANAGVHSKMDTNTNTSNSNTSNSNTSNSTSTSTSISTTTRTSNCTNDTLTNGQGQC